ncbi:MAG: ribonuclease III [Clostridia bacterium]|nr:ribonuclease III [Clostridia bacterium]MBR5743100.1 ribonuclease III [Clostridia bacterium]
MRDRKEMGSLELAYLGDAVYELEVRKHLLENDWGSPGEMNRKALFYVTAEAQARAAEKVLPFLTEEEEAVFRRGRNAHPKAAPKHADPGEYALATGLEALFGFLSLGGEGERIACLFALCRGALEEEKV